MLILSALMVWCENLRGDKPRGGIAGLLGHRVYLELTCPSSARLSSGNQSTLPPEGPCISVSLPMFAIIQLSNFGQYNRYKVVYHCCFNLHFSDY